VLVAENVAYVTAGFWPSDGVYLYALDATSGAVKWTRDDMGYAGIGFVDMVDGNHQGEFGYRGASPQGPLLYESGVIVIPQGHSNPMRLSATDGQPVGRESLGEERGQAWAAKMVEAQEAKGATIPSEEHIARAAEMLGNRGSGRPGSGGNWVTIDGETMYVLAMHRGRKTYLNAWNIHTGEYTALNHSDKVVPQIAGEGLNRTVAPGRCAHGRALDWRPRLQHRCPRRHRRWTGRRAAGDRRDRDRGAPDHSRLLAEAGGNQTVARERRASDGRRRLLRRAGLVLPR
jgi:hypothetical protein